MPASSILKQTSLDRGAIGGLASSLASDGLTTEGLFGGVIDIDEAGGGRESVEIVSSREGIESRRSMWFSRRFVERTFFADCFMWARLVVTSGERYLLTAA